MLATLRVLLAVLLIPIPTLAQPLPTDSRLVTGEFDNGMKYIVRRHAVPPGRAAVWLHVPSGSLNETDPQRGIAHFLEHMAFNGSENFAPGTVLPFFQSLGLTFGVHQNAFTSFDQTVYQLALPDSTPETFDKGLLFLSDVAFRLTLPPKEIERERQIILEEKRASLGGRQRNFEEIIKRWAPGSLVGERLPIGVVETIGSVEQDDFREYYSRWYVPSNMTVLAVSDMDDAVVIEHLRKHFSEGKRVPAPQDQDARVTAARENRAIVASDPEISRADVSILRVTPARPPTTTVEQARRDLVEAIGEWAFGRRMSRRVSEGKASFLRAGATAGDEFRAIRLADASAGGDPSKWRPMLEELATELRRAVLHGFTPREIEDARKELLAGAERAVETEPTLPARTLLGAMNNAVAEGEPITSAGQDLDLVRQLLPTITPEEVAAAFKGNFDPGPAGLLFVLEVPSTAEVPSEQDFIALATEALKTTPQAEADAARASALMEAPPTPGEVAEAEVHEPSAVWSAWLSNNVRLHHRFMDYRKDQVSVTITLAAGTIQETAEDRGIAEAAAIAWQRPATSTLSSTDIRDLMTGKKVTVTGRPGMDTMAVSVSGSPDDLETGLQLAHLLLTDPAVEQPAFDQWRQQQEQLLAIRSLQIEFVFSDLFDATTYPKGDARFRPLGAEDLQRLSRDRAQSWLRKAIAEAPIEVSIVGEIPRERAIELARGYIGSLPARPRISPDTLNKLRTLDRPRGPLAARAEVATETDKAIAVSGFFGAERDDVLNQQLLTIAARVLTNRMIEVVREKEQLVYSIGATSSGALEFPGYGTFWALSYTDPAKLDALQETLRGMYAGFAESGPTEDEMQTVRRQIDTALDERMLEPAFWTGVLAGLTFRNTRLQDVVDAPAAYQAHPGAAVREAFASFYTPEGTFEVAATPKQDAPPSPANDRGPPP